MLGCRLDEQSSRSAPDFSFNDECGNRAGVIEITSSAEYQKPRTEEDDFKFEAIRHIIKQKVESLDLTKFNCKWCYELELPSPGFNFLDKINWNKFENALIGALNQLEDEGKFSPPYRTDRLVFGCKSGYVFFLHREELSNKPILHVPTGQTRFTGPPDYYALKQALEHIRSKFVGITGVKIGLIDLTHWMAAEHTNELDILAHKSDYHEIDRLFLIDNSFSERSDKQPEKWKKYGHYQLMKVW